MLMMRHHGDDVYNDVTANRSPNCYIPLLNNYTAFV